MLALVLSLSPAQGHDPSAWGGLFRSRDDGANWMSANRGIFLSGVIALVVNPTDANHLLLGAESGLFRSRNGGRDWMIEAPAVVRGSVLAAAFSADGRQAMISTGLGIFRSTDNGEWQLAPAPRDAGPARAIVPGGMGSFWLASQSGLYRSDDRSASWSTPGNGFPRDPATVLLAAHGMLETVYAIVRGQLWASVDGGANWTRRGSGVPLGNIEALAQDARQPALLWAAGAGQVFNSTDAGTSWQSAGPPLPEPTTIVHGIAASGEAIVVTTDRGIYRRSNDSANWTAIIDNLPAHLEAGPLVRDPIEPTTLYAGFSLIPYPELWRRAVDRESAFSRVSAASLAGSAVLLVLLAIIALATLRWLGRYYSNSLPPMRSAPDTRVQGKRLP